MKDYFVYTLLAAVAILCCNTSMGQSAYPEGLKIVIIRHGEKPDKGDNLSCQGLNRALALPPVLHQKIGLPSKIYVPSLKLGKSTAVARMYQTILPYAIKYDLEINTKFDETDAQGIAGALKKANGTVLLVWEHKAISKILKALGINSESYKWDESDYDSIYLITFHNGIPAIVKDRENLHPSPECQ